MKFKSESFFQNKITFVTKYVHKFNKTNSKNLKKLKSLKHLSKFWRIGSIYVKKFKFFSKSLLGEILSGCSSYFLQ